MAGRLFAAGPIHGCLFPHSVFSAVVNCGVAMFVQCEADHGALLGTAEPLWAARRTRPCLQVQWKRVSLERRWWWWDGSHTLKCGMSSVYCSSHSSDQVIFWPGARQWHENPELSVQCHFFIIDRIKGSTFCQMPFLCHTLLTFFCLCKISEV